MYAPVFGHEYVNFDDDLFILGDPGLRLGLSFAGLEHAFTSTYSGNWFPLTRVSWLLDQEIHGLSTAGTHLGNLIIHLLNTALLFLALRRLTGHVGRSAVAAGIFGLHPLNVETVAWAIERKGLLAASAFMGALWVHAAVGERVRRAFAVALLMALGLMAKSVLVTLPGVLLLLDYWPLRRMEAAQGKIKAQRVVACCVEKLPQLVLVVLASLVTIEAQVGAGATRSLAALTLDERLANALTAYPRYLGKLFWPFDLSVFYPHPRDEYSGLAVAGSLLLLTGVSAAALRLRRERPAFLIGWLWFLGMLVPTLGLVQVGGQSMADRYAYLPAIGIALALVWTASEWLGPRSLLAALLSVAALGTLASQSRVQLEHWRDSETLFRHALAITEKNHIAHTQLAEALLQRGRMAEAVPHLRSALKFDRENLDALNNLAWALATDATSSRDEVREAESLALHAARMAPDDPNVLDTLAVAHARGGDYSRARAAAERALTLAKQSGNQSLVGILNERLARFRAGRPYTEGP